MKRKLSPRTRKLTVILLVIAMLFSFASSGLAANAEVQNGAVPQDGLYIGGDVLTYYTWGEYNFGDIPLRIQITLEMMQAGFSNVNFVENGKIANLRDILDFGFEAAKGDFEPGDLEEEYTDTDGNPVYPPQPEEVFEAYFEPSITIDPDPIEPGGFNVEYKVTNTGTVTGETDIEYSAWVSFDEGATWQSVGMVILHEDVEIDATDQVTYEEGYNADAGSMWEFHLTTDDETVVEERTVEDEEDEVDLEWAYAGDETEFDDALNAVAAGAANAIELTGNITLNDRVRIEAEWDLYEINMKGYSITLADPTGPLAFMANDTTVYDGAIFGAVTWWSWEGPGNPDSWTGSEWETWQNSNRVMVSGDGVTFDNVIFHVDIADWYQEQGDKDATDLTVENSDLHGVSLFNSNVYLYNNDIYNRVGIESDDAVLEENTLLAATEHAATAGLYGILYINSDAYLLNNTWDDNFTGMFVGKSLKYYGEEKPVGYSEARPILDGAKINTDKYGLVWWAINYEKAELRTTGRVDIYSDRGGPGLMLVGTDYRDYVDDDGWDGGRILGDATFTGADVWFGKPTVEFLTEGEEPYKNYEGPWYHDDEGDKCPICLKEVDYQVCKKDADRLEIHGPDFTGVNVTIFTPANDYIGCERTSRGVCLNDPVWLGDVTFGYVALWGDFDIVRGKTVIFDEIELMCGNIRRIGSDRDLGEKDVCTDDPPSFVRRGRLVGGEITSDTKYPNVLVIGDGVKVINVELTKFLYNVILETVWLRNVDINVGEEPTKDLERLVCGYDLNNYPDGNLYDVFVWRGNHATFDGGSLSKNSSVEVMDLSFLTIVDPADFVNNGEIKVQKRGNVNIDPFEAEIKISQTGGRAFVDFDVEADAGWKFNDWKPDIWIEAGDEIYSKKYEIIYEGEVYTVDLSDPNNPKLNGQPHPNAPFDISKGAGIWLTDLLNIDRETLAAVVGSTGLSFRLSLDRDTAAAVSFQLDVTGYIFNSCGCGKAVANDDKVIDLTGKFVQGFKPSIECEVNGNIVTVTARVKNTTNHPETQEVSGWIVEGGSVIASFIDEPVFLLPGETRVETWTFDLRDYPEYDDVGQTFTFTFWLATEDDTTSRTCSVTVCAPFVVGVDTFEAGSQASAEIGEGSSGAFSVTTDNVGSSMNDWTIDVSRRTGLNFGPLVVAIDTTAKTIDITLRRGADGHEYPENQAANIVSIINAENAGLTAVVVDDGRITHDDSDTFTGGSDIVIHAEWNMLVDIIGALLSDFTLDGADAAATGEVLITPAVDYTSQWIYFDDVVPLAASQPLSFAAGAVNNFFCGDNLEEEWHYDGANWFK